MRKVHHSQALALVALTLSLVTLSSAERAIAQEFQSGDIDSRVQVVARGGGFPSLNPRVAPVESGTYRVRSDDSAFTANDNSIEIESEETSVATDAVPLDPTPASSRDKMIAPLVTVASSLAIVLALFCGLVWAGRRFGGAANVSKPLPSSALTPLGHVMIDPRTKLMLVKCGRRILVLSQSASGITPISEVTHPDEVRELIASCSSEAREVFQRTLREIELEPAKGFTDPASTAKNTARANGRLFATA